MGYVSAIGQCFACRGTFSFNPVRVPSFRDKSGARQPVCRGCMTKVNEKRKAMGFEPFAIAADAYEFCGEEELEA